MVQIATAVGMDPSTGLSQSAQQATNLLEKSPRHLEEVSALSAEMKMRRLKESKDYTDDQRPAQQKAEPPADCFVTPVPASRIHCAAPMTPPPMPPPVTALKTETDQEFAVRVRCS